MNMLIRLFALLFLSTAAQAHPTSFEGGYALMSEISGKSQEISMVYSPKFWLGTGLVYIAEKDKHEAITTQMGWLPKRWNLPNAQGNIYLVAGAGYGKLEATDTEPEMDGGIYRLGLQADFETRRIYTFARFVENRFFEDSKILSNSLSLAVGFAPYLAEFNELNSWVILKASKGNDSSQWKLTPMLRFFYKNFLWELGQDFNGNSMLNFMVRF